MSALRECSFLWAHSTSWWLTSRCVRDEGQVVAMKLQHKKECKGLIVQIRYLKAKFTRESALRNDLSYQKQYLLVLLARFERK